MPQFLCLTAKLCPNLTAPENGYIRGSKFTYSSSLYFACQYGYILKRGDGVRTCNESGQWLGETAACGRNPTLYRCVISPCPILLHCCLGVECRSPIAPSHGGVTRGPFFYSQKAEFWCGGQYAVLGHHKSVCLSNGVWSTSPPLCVG